MRGEMMKSVGEIIVMYARGHNQRIGKIIRGPRLLAASDADAPAFATASIDASLSF